MKWLTTYGCVNIVGRKYMYAQHWISQKAPNQNKVETKWLRSYWWYSQTTFLSGNYCALMWYLTNFLLGALFHNNSLLAHAWTWHQAAGKDALIMFIPQTIDEILHHRLSIIILYTDVRLASTKTSACKILSKILPVVTNKILRPGCL